MYIEVYIQLYNHVESVQIKFRKSKSHLACCSQPACLDLIYDSLNGKNN